MVGRHHRQGKAVSPVSQASLEDQDSQEHQERLVARVEPEATGVEGGDEGVMVVECFVGWNRRTKRVS